MSSLFTDQPGGLPGVIQEQTDFDVNPTDSDIGASGVSQIGIQSLGSGCSEKNCPEQPKTVGIFGEELIRIVRIYGFQDR